MITADLVSYIRKQNERNIPKSIIVSKLVSAGWVEEDIEEGFEKVRKEDEKINSFISQREDPKTFDLKVKEGDSFSSDKYREPLDESDPLAKKEAPTIIREEIKEVEVKQELKPEVKTEEVFPAQEKAQEQTQAIELQELQLSQGEEKTEKEEKGNIWVPRNIPVKEFSPVEEIFINQKIEIPTEEVKEVIKEEQKEAPKEAPKEETKKDYSLNNLPKIAILSTYPKDVQMVNNRLKEDAKSGVAFNPIPRKSKLKWIILGLAVVLIIGAGTWAFASGVIDIKSIVSKINVKNINIPFIKKDPRALILNNSKTLSALEHYKTETSVEVSFPSFASLSAGLLAGEAVSSLDKDNIVFMSNGRVNQKDGKFISENSVSVKGSALQNFINSNIKNDGEYLYVDIPDLKLMLKENAPTPSTVKIKKEEFTGIPSLFGPKAEKILTKINLFNLLSDGVSSYIDKEMLGSYDELIKAVKITEKGEENIKGVDTYHYSINPDRQIFKNLLTKITDRFMSNQTEEEKTLLSVIVGSTIVKSFDVWVGKGDNTIYQYSLVLDVPVSKLVGFEDKSIGDSVASVTAKTTYYDFKNPNEISLPESPVLAPDFIRNTKIEKIKNKVASFYSLAESLHKIEKKYGIKSNTIGDCMNPVSGSLFSPLGHPKSATLPVGYISLLLNEILTTTEGLGVCKSSATAWAFAVPLSDSYGKDMPLDNYNTFYCVDSKGIKIETSSMPTGTACPTEVPVL